MSVATNPSPARTSLEEFTVDSQGISDSQKPLWPRSAFGDSSDYFDIRRDRENPRAKTLPKPKAIGGPILTIKHTIHSSRRWLDGNTPRWMHLGGWRQTVKGGATVAVCVLVLNLVILAWGWRRDQNPITGQRMVAWGDCGAMKNISTYWHFAINVFSTLLLATSNAAMQCLSAPTREAVDRAHKEGTWVDIGISGLRNWRHMDRWRKWCWILLVASTVPLHLLYNSVIFSTTTANEYWALAVSPDFLGGANFTIPNQTDFLAYSPEEVIQPSTVENIRSVAGNDTAVERLNSESCIATYSQTMLSQYSNVLLVARSTNSSGNSSLLRYYYHAPVPDQFDPSKTFAANWICGEPDSLYFRDAGCNLTDLYDNVDKWNLTAQLSYGGNPQRWAPPIDVDYCLAQTVQPVCTVELIPEIMIIVIVANIVKVACFVSILKTMSFKPLVTLGDCLASCLQRPDPYTQDLGALSAENIRQALSRSRRRDTNREICYRRERLLAKSTGENSERLELQDYAQLGQPDQNSAEPLEERPDPLPGLPLELGPWKSTRRRWFSGASRLRWTLTYSLLMSSWIAGFSTLLPLAMFDKQSGDFADQWSTGFGNVSPNFLLQPSALGSLIGNSIIANLPQLGLSLVYISLNGLWTCILLTREFTLFATRREGLRVSEPAGRFQRSTNWLSLPYRFSIPLVALSWALHWALSQTLFLAEIIIYSPDGERNERSSVSTLGYSLLALMILLIIETVAIITPLLLGWIRYYEGSPLVESYSLAISAACHPTPQMSDQSSDLLKYGAVEEEYSDGDEDTTITPVASVFSPQVEGFRLASDVKRHANTMPYSMSNDATRLPQSYSLAPSSTPTPTSTTPNRDRTSGSLSRVSHVRSSSASVLLPRRRLIATLSKDSVMPLTAPHTHTSIRTLTAEELDPDRTYRIPHGRARRMLRWLLPTGGFLKLCALIFTVMDIFVPVGSDAGYISVWIVGGLGMLHLVIRFVIQLFRLRRKSASHRRFWWHVGPEFIFGLAWVFINLGTLTTYPLRVGYDMSLNIWARIPIVVLPLLYFPCGIAELWLWSLANPGFTRAAVSDLCRGRWKFPELQRLRRIAS